MRQTLLLLIGWVVSISLSAQADREALLIKKAEAAKNDLEKIEALNDLAEYYYVFKQEQKADSISKIELLIADLSPDKDLLLKVLYSNVTSNISKWTGPETFERAFAFLDKGIAYAKETGKEEYEAIAYIRKAGLLRKRNAYDRALEQATLAFSALGNQYHDSLKAALYLETGEIFLAKGDAVSAYRNYNNAFDLAYNIKNFQLQSEAFHHFADLYLTLANKDLAKEYLFKSVTINTERNDRMGLLKDYIHLGRITDEVTYINKALELSAELNSYIYMLYSKRLMFAYIMVIRKDRQAALDYLEKNADLKTSFTNLGMPNYFWNIGNIYKYANMPDSALYYYQLAEPGLVSILDKSNEQSIYMEMADCYRLLNRVNDAIRYYTKSMAISRDNLAINGQLTLLLSELYSKAGDFRKALDFLQQHRFYTDTLNKLAAQRDVTLLEMERENTKHQKDLAELALLERNKRNLQYMSITFAIAGLFFLMVLVGMFPVSKLSIRLMGYFTFICLFEFIVLLIDTYLHHLTNGEPLKQWLIKIFLIALLVPFQHYLEHGLIQFIQSRALVRLRNQLSLKKWWAGLHKAPAPEEAGIEEGTAVL